MFLRKTSRFKDGKTHDAIDELEERKTVDERDYLIPPPPPDPPREAKSPVKISLSKMKVENIRAVRTARTGSRSSRPSSSTT